jgi:TonB family protein
MVLSMESDVAGKSIFLSEVGDLDPNTSRPVELFFPLKSQLGPGKYEVHLFSEGAEVFQSQIPFWVRSNALNKMVAKRIEGVDKAAPKFLIGPEPIYPKSLRDANITGKAVVTVRIAVNGEPLDPVLKSATDPEFGKAALLALQDWRFLPRVKDGHPVETKVDVPFIFSPPKPSPAG